MPCPDLPSGGSCRCTHIRFRLDAPPMLTLACHCRDCQRMSASAFSLGAMVQAGGFTITDGTPVERSLPGSLRHHFFCPRCMTWLFTRIQSSETRVNFRPTLCDDPGWFVPFVEMMTQDRLPWARTPAPHSFQGFPSPEDLQDLLALFPRWRPA